MPHLKYREPEPRSAGRSFDHPSTPLGAELIETGATPDNVADRAKAIAVLRKAEEFMHTHNPAPISRRNERLALELAAERIGVSIQEYDAIIDSDGELLELEEKVLEDALRRG